MFEREAEEWEKEMTEEELRKESTYTVQWERTPMLDRPTFVNGYITGSKPRENRIAELEKENTELKEQIDKMKRHSNCKYRSEYNEFDPYNKVCQSCCNLEKWEFGL